MDLFLCCLAQILYAVPDAFRRIFWRFRTPACQRVSLRVRACHIRSQERPPQRRSRSPPVTLCHLSFRKTYKYIAYIIYMHILKTCYTVLKFIKALSEGKKRRNDNYQPSTYHDTRCIYFLA
jgi:hypothetical protein